MTLAAKAAYFLQLLRARHIRPPGLVGPAVLVTPGDVSQSFIEDDDNDGEHTGMYCAIESMRYAVTKDPTARENARAAFHALMVLQQATGDAALHRPLRPAPRHTTAPRGRPNVHPGRDRRHAPSHSPREDHCKALDSECGRQVAVEAGRQFRRDGRAYVRLRHLLRPGCRTTARRNSLPIRWTASLAASWIMGMSCRTWTARGTQWGNWSPQSLKPRSHLA